MATTSPFIPFTCAIVNQVGNDACWTQIEREQIPMFNSDVACPLEYCSYDTVAQGYGGEGFTVSGGSPADTTTLLQKAQAEARKGTVSIWMCPQHHSRVIFTVHCGHRL